MDIASIPGKLKGSVDMLSDAAKIRAPAGSRGRSSHDIRSFAGQHQDLWRELGSGESVGEWKVPEFTHSDSQGLRALMR